jgi:hypothetical protein
MHTDSHGRLSVTRALIRVHPFSSVVETKFSL